MNTIHLNVTQATRKKMQQQLKDAYRMGNRRVVRRITALFSLIQGRSYVETAEVVGVTRQALYDWVRDLIVHGLESLTYRRSPGRPARLTKTQKRRLTELIDAGPEAAGFATGCWTSLLVQQLIEREFGVLYNRHYVCELLRNLGFSFQKAKFVSDHLDPAARQTWREETWPEIVQLAEKLDAWILFEDEVSFAQWGSLGYTWARQGQQPVVQTSGRRKGYKVFGAIEFFSGRFVWQTLTDRFNSASYQGFLSYLLDQTAHPIILIQDGARYHTSRNTRDFFAQHQDRLIVYQLPSYSPDYNPIERLWKQIKVRATHNRYFAEFASLKQTVDEALRAFAQETECIKNLMGCYLPEQDRVPAAATV